jgi:hypothetical protein
MTPPIELISTKHPNATSIETHVGKTWHPLVDTLEILKNA